MNYSINFASLFLLFTAVHAALASTKPRHNLRKKTQPKNMISGTTDRRKYSRNLRTGHDVNESQQHGVMKMELLTDRYPGETSWKIIDNCNEDSVVMSGRNYDTPFTNVEDSASLPPSQYTLEVKDTYGDGICCGQGNGSFRVTFNNDIVASGGQFGKSESQTWGSCDLPTSTTTPTASPTAAPTACEMSYELVLKAAAAGSSSSGAFWDFAYGQDRAKIAASSSGISYSPGSTSLEKGCLPKNCYRFQIRGGVQIYSLFVDGVEVVSGTSAMEENANINETGLFGTCETI